MELTTGRFSYSHSSSTLFFFLFLAGQAEPAEVGAKDKAEERDGQGKTVQGMGDWGAKSPKSRNKPAFE